MYPKVVIDIKKLEQNLEAVAHLTKDKAHCSLAVVTKGMCADPEMVKMVAKNPRPDFLADSRIKNIKTYTDLAHENGKKTMLLRIPMQSELEDLVTYVDLALISDIDTIRKLNEVAGRAGKVQQILLMIDMGDLREGLFYQDKETIIKTVEAILSFKNISLYGVGVNLTCYGAIIPKQDNLGNLVAIAREIEQHFGIKLRMISGGNSSSVYLIEQGGLPEGINNLRLGESFLLGNDTAYFAKLPGTTDATILLQAEIVEIKVKPSLPIGEVGKDAFGQVPEYEDRGMMRRAIIAVGQQDIVLDSMEPLDKNIAIMGGSSDHTILDVTHTEKEYHTGDIVTFKLGYGGMLRAMTSPYVDKEYVNRK